MNRSSEDEPMVFDVPHINSSVGALPAPPPPPKRAPARRGEFMAILGYEGKWWRDNWTSKCLHHRSLKSINEEKDEVRKHKRKSSECDGGAARERVTFFHSFLFPRRNGMIFGGTEATKERRQGGGLDCRTRVSCALHNFQNFCAHHVSFVGCCTRR